MLEAKCSASSTQEHEVALHRSLRRVDQQYMERGHSTSHGHGHGHGQRDLGLDSDAELRHFVSLIEDQRCKTDIVILRG
jgi:hypothetical protein